MIKPVMAKAFAFRGHYTYWCLYDHEAGCDNRYTVMVLNAEDPVIIGREVTLAHGKRLIAELEEHIQKRFAVESEDPESEWGFGHHSDIVGLLEEIQEKEG